MCVSLTGNRPPVRSCRQGYVCLCGVVYTYHILPNGCIYQLQVPRKRNSLTSQEKFYCQNETFSSLWTRQEETMHFFLYTIVIMEVKREPVRGENLFKIFGRMK